MSTREALARAEDLAPWLYRPGPGAGVPKMVCSMVLGVNGEKVDEFLAHAPSAEPLIEQIFAAGSSDAERQRRTYARKKFIGLFIPLPVAEEYKRTIPAPRPCAWCQEEFIPFRKSQIYCGPGCKNARSNFWKSERQRWKDAGGFTMTLFEESKKRMWKSMARTRKHRATYWANRFERQQQNRRFPDW